jgi:hypothetical protein
VGAERALRLNGADKTAMALGEVSPAGDLAPLGDVWRGTVLALARWRAIPEDALSGADERLDVPLKALLERGEGDPALRRRLHAAEPQRRRAPPLIKISADAFGLDRRYPLTNAFSAEAPTA